MAKFFDKGVTKYTICNLDINISFPEDEVKCRWCPFLKHLESLDRDRCGITEEILYTREFTGYKCPLTILNEVETEEMKK